jgi:predicted nuclease of predicted toxin-antitoxin system
MPTKRPRLVWIDSHLPVGLAPWISRTFSVRCHHIGELGLMHADDGSIFAAARRKRAVLLSKDGDFAILVERAGPPPQVLWLVCGNIALARIRAVLQAEMRPALKALDHGAAVVRLGTPPHRRRG